MSTARGGAVRFGAQEAAPGRELPLFIIAAGGGPKLDSPSSLRLTTFVHIRSLPKVIGEFGAAFAERGFACHLVGGAVRDLLAGRPTTDYDFATDARPEQVMRLFARVIPTGVKHGTVTVLFRGFEMEVTTFRADGSYSDARHPDSVRFGASIEEDLKRRDFTINSMAIDLSTLALLDPHGGRSDLKARTIRAIGEPAERFTEDGLRLLRACRFSAQLEFSVEARTKDGMRRASDRIDRVSAERIQEELTKILQTDRPSIAFLLMDETTILERVLPELCEGKGVEQKGIHNFDVLAHSLYACDGAPSDRIEIRLAALLHDIGKPRARAFGADGMPTFYGHEETSAEMASKVLKRLRFSNALEARVCHLIRHHMFHYEENWTDAAIRRFVARVGTDAIDDLFLLRRADTYGAVGRQVDDPRLAEFRDHIERTLRKDSALAIRDLAVSGDDLAELGVPRGPVMGALLKQLLETVLDDPALNERSRLLEIARRLYEHSLKSLEQK